MQPQPTGENALQESSQSSLLTVPEPFHQCNSASASSSSNEGQDGIKDDDIARPRALSRTKDVSASLESSPGGKPGGVLLKQLKSLRRKVSNIVGVPKNATPNVVVKSSLALRRLHIQKHHAPRYIGTHADNQFISETVLHIWKVIIEVQQASSFANAVIGLSGGTTPKRLYQMLSLICNNLKSREHKDVAGIIDWNRVKIFLVDERYVPCDNEASNQKLLRDTLLNGADIIVPEENLIFPDTSLPLDECVLDYDTRLKALFALAGCPHLVTLGFGEDGHCASWFPPLSDADYTEAHNADKVVAHTTQTRFPVKDRITVSLDIINAANQKLFMINKEKAIAKWKQLMAMPSDHTRAQPVLQVLESGDVTVISNPPIIEDLFTDFHSGSLKHLTVVIFGASGDLAKRKTIPSLFSLFCEGHLPTNFHIVGYARSRLAFDKFWDNLEPYLVYVCIAVSQYFSKLDSYYRACLECQAQLHRDPSLGFLESFKERITYLSGNYDDPAAYFRLNELICSLEESSCGKLCKRDRLFYLALPPDVFAPAIQNARQTCWSHSGWNRVVIEKPFGTDSESAKKLSDEILAVLSEKEVFRMDHYLGKEMVLNLMVFRFANAAFSPLMSWNHVSSVRITFKEMIGMEGRAQYFEKSGIIRDIMQNHLLQILTIVAMERPASLAPDDVRDEKVKVLKQIQPLKLSDVILGQYTRSSDDNVPGFLEESGVPTDSHCPTFCTAVFYVKNERWAGVPFIMKAGKALEERSTEIRIQFRSVAGNLFGEEVPRNELVVKIQPNEAIYLKVVAKKPGLAQGLEQTELDFTVTDRFDVGRLPDAYERLLVDVMKGDQQKTDELYEAWKIFSPLLHEIDHKRVKPIAYPANSSGPKESYDFIRSLGYKRYEGYYWEKVAIA